MHLLSLVFFFFFFFFRKDYDKMYLFPSLSPFSFVFVWSIPPFDLDLRWETRAWILFSFSRRNEDGLWIVFTRWRKGRREEILRLLYVVRKLAARTCTRIRMRVVRNSWVFQTVANLNPCKGEGKIERPISEWTMNPAAKNNPKIIRFPSAIH